MVKPNENPFQIILDNKMLEVLSERSRILTHEQALIDLICRRVTVRTKVSKNDRHFYLNPGEAEIPISTLAKDWDWDRKTVRRFLQDLENTGCIETRKYAYGTVAVFPTLITSPPQSAETSPSQIKDSSPSSIDEQPYSFEDSHPKVSIDDSIGSLRYDGPPLEIDEATRVRLQKIHERFALRLPLLERPPYDDRIEKAIYLVFIIGMNGDDSLMDDFLDRVASNEAMNGELALLTGDKDDKESFMSLFSPKWQEILFPGA